MEKMKVFGIIKWKLFIGFVNFTPKNEIAFS
jgi:hypothetical protein